MSLFYRFVSLIALTASLGFVATTHASLVVTDGSANIITFDADVPGVYQSRTGSGVARSLTEPDDFGRSVFNVNLPATLLPEGAAVLQQFSNISGGGPNAPSLFGTDFNNDGDSADQFQNPNGPIVALAPGGPISGDAFRLTNEGDFANTAVYIRIQNNTGATVDTWDIGAELFSRDTGGGFSTIQFSHAASNATDPGSITFTDVAGPAITDTSGSIVALPGISETISVTVANGDFLVIGFADTAASASGSEVFLDNISVTAVPEPGGLVLAGLGGVFLATRRRCS